MIGTDILIVEDERILARDLETTLERAGYRVAGTAATGEEAIFSAEKCRPDLIIMDVILQGDLDGIETADHIKRNFDIPVLFLSSFRDPTLLERAKSTEAIGYLIKPYEEEDLLTTIEMALHQHLTHRRRAQRALAISEARFQALYASCPLGIALVDGDGNTLAVNPAFRRLLNFGPGKVEGTPFPSLIHPGDLAIERRLAQELAAGSRTSYEVRQRQRASDGTYLCVRATVSRFPMEEGGETALTVRMIQDLSEQKALQDRLVDAQRLESIGRLTVGLVHNLGNDLTPVLVGVSMLQNEKKYQEFRQMLDVMEASLKRGSGLIRQILRIGRPCAEQRAPLDCGAVLVEVAAIVRQAFSKGIAVRTNVATDLRQAAGNPDELHQCLLNLCMNARDAMPDGGSLQLAARNVVVNAAPANAQPGPYVLLAVTDTGSGIAPEIQERIFEPFFTTKAPNHGTGLGLATTWEIVKNHGGFMRVQSTVGQGAEFQIFLPAIEPLKAVAADLVGMQTALAGAAPMSSLAKQSDDKGVTVPAR